MKKLIGYAAALFAAALMTIEPAALTAPVMGDRSAKLMGIMIVLLIVSLVLIVVFALLSMGKKKRKK